MKNSRDGKSYSTNLAFTPPEYLRTGEYCLQIVPCVAMYLDDATCYYLSAVSLSVSLPYNKQIFGP